MNLSLSKYMNVINKRINILTYLVKSVIHIPSQVPEVPFTSKLSSLFQFYGLRKFKILHAMHVCENTDRCHKRVTINDRTIYWPRIAPEQRLVDMYFEVFHKNCHRFDTCGTPLIVNDVVIDAGCCEGYFAMLAIEKGASKVYCFEPGKTIGKCLQQTFSKEIIDNHVEIIPMLLGNNCSRFDFLEDPEDPTTGQILPETVRIEDKCKYSVEMTTLDLFCKARQIENINFIKIDVEGAEPEVIVGAKDIIKRFAPRIAVATYHSPHHAQQLQEMIFSINNAYQFQLKGLVDLDGVVRPVMLHCHVPS